MHGQVGIQIARLPDFRDSLCERRADCKLDRLEVLNKFEAFFYWRIFLSKQHRAFFLVTVNFIYSSCLIHLTLLCFDFVFPLLGLVCRLKVLFECEQSLFRLQLHCHDSLHLSPANPHFRVLQVLTFLVIRLLLPL